MGWHDRVQGMVLVLVSCVCGAVLPDARAQEVSAGPPPRRICIVLGAAGEPQYGERFQAWGERWREGTSDWDQLFLDGTAGAPSSAQTSPESPEERSVDHRSRILQWVDEASPEAAENWLVLIGHGTHDQQNTHFNLQGPDLSAEELAKGMANRSGRWIIAICASSSAPFLKALSGPDRIVITATKSGSEQNFSRFGEYLSQAILDASADLDHDANVSVLEAFLAASQSVAKYYTEQGLLPTEQALIDDNGDGRGTPAVFYRGVRAIKAPAEGATLDGALARRVSLRPNLALSSLTPEAWLEMESLERELEKLRENKNNLTSEEYFEALERLFLRIAALRGMIPSHE
jgi:hypothetical protein